MLSAYARIFQRQRPYVVAAAALQDRLQFDPLGVEVRPDDRFDPLQQGSAGFFDLIQRLDQLTFGPLGLTMPRWALYDCGMLPGFVFGFGADAADLRPRVHQALGVPADYAGLVPLSMYIAIPMLGEDRWLGHSVCSVNEVAPGAAPPGLGTLSVAMGLACLGAKRASGATQWRSPKLAALARFAPLSLDAAWVPIHNEPETCVFHFPVDEPRLRHGLDPDAPAAEADIWLDTEDEAALQELQASLQDGERWAIVGPPEIRGAWRGVPLAREVSP